MTGELERVEALRALVECRSPLPERIALVGGFPWDCDSVLVRLEREHVVSVLRRFLQEGLSAQDVEMWADALEGRDDLGYDSEVGALLFQLSTPIINGGLTAEMAESLLERYDGLPNKHKP